MLLKWKSKKSFSLLEMMMVALVLTILVSISAAQYFRAAEKARTAQATEVLTKIYRGYKVRVAEELSIPTMSGCNWAGDFGFDDFNAAAPCIQTKFFNFYYVSVGTRYAQAHRRRLDGSDDAAKWIRIYLDNGTITKSSYYD